MVKKIDGQEPDINKQIQDMNSHINDSSAPVEPAGGKVSNQAGEEEEHIMTPAERLKEINGKVEKEALNDQDLSVLHAKLGLTDQMDATDFVTGKTKTKNGIIQYDNQNQPKAGEGKKVTNSSMSSTKPANKKKSSKKHRNQHKQQPKKQTTDQQVAANKQKYGSIQNTPDSEVPSAQYQPNKTNDPNYDQFYDSYDKSKGMRDVGEIVEVETIHGVKVPKIVSASGDLVPYFGEKKGSLSDKEEAKKTGAYDIKTQPPGTIKGQVNQAPTEPEYYDDLPDFSNIDINLDQVEYVDEDKDLSSMIKDNFDYRLKSRPTTETVLNQSGYVAFMLSLTLNDISTVLNSVEESYTSLKDKYEMLYNKMQTSNVGKFTFEEFLDATALTDVDSLYYGLFCTTYPEATKFDFKCQNCGKDIKGFPVPNAALTIIHSDDALEKREKIVKNIEDKVALARYSTLNKVKQVLLPHSKTIINIRTPSLRNHLNIMYNLQDEPSSQEAFNLLLFCKDISVIDLKHYKETKKIQYIKTDDMQQEYDILRQMNIKDFKVLAEVISDWSMAYAVDYGIGKVECPFCHETNTDIQVDIEKLVFRQTLEQLG